MRGQRVGLRISTELPCNAVNPLANFFIHKPRDGRSRTDSVQLCPPHPEGIQNDRQILFRQIRSSTSRAFFDLRAGLTP